MRTYSYIILIHDRAKNLETSLMKVATKSEAMLLQIIKPDYQQLAA
jgi:hypothetical protein